MEEWKGSLIGKIHHHKKTIIYNSSIRTNVEGLSFDEGGQCFWVSFTTAQKEDLQSIMPVGLEETDLGFGLVIAAACKSLKNDSSTKSKAFILRMSCIKYKDKQKILTKNPLSFLKQAQVATLL